MKTYYKATKISFEYNQPKYVGIDVSKETLDIFLRPGGRELRFANDMKGVASLCNALKQIVVQLVVIEATGGMERLAAKEMYLNGLPVAVINPKQARDFAKATGKLAKTDKLDASVLAHFGEAIRPQVRAPKNEKMERLSLLVARRTQLVEMLATEKIRLKQADNFIVKQIKSVLKFLETKLKTLDKSIDVLINDDAVLAKKRDLVVSVPGVARGTAISLIAELPELGKVSKKEIAALVGVAPFNRDSGKTSGKRMIWGGRARVRKALYMAAVSGMRYNSTIKDFYTRLLNSGKKPKVALVACMHKLAIILNSMLKNEVYWQEQQVR